MNKISLLVIFVIIFINFSFINTTNACPSGIKDKEMGFVEKMVEKDKKFEKKQIEYCLSGGKKGNLSKRTNTLLKMHQVGDCLKDGLNQKKFDKIAGGNFEELSKNMKDDCKDEDGAISNELAKKMIQEMGGMKQQCKQQAKEKIRQLNKISSIGQYADGNSKNSPFDIINTLKKIDKKLYREETKYESDEQEPEQTLNEYLEDPFTYMERYEKRNNKIRTKIKKDKEKDKNKKKNEKKKLGDNSLGTGTKDKNSKTTTEEDETSIIYTNENTDGNEYECTSYPGTQKTGLSEESEKILLDTIQHEPTNRSFIFHFGSGSRKKMPNSNRLTGSGTSIIPGGESGDSEGENQDQNNNKCKGYKPVNDDKKWKCNNIICIIIKIIMGEYKPLDYGEGQGGNQNAGKSIENILETSNYHTYKASHTSLAQHKISTNNFEKTCRHLNFGKMLNMSVQISSQPVPNLSLSSDNGGGGGGGGGNSCQ